MSTLNQDKARHQLARDPRNRCQWCGKPYAQFEWLEAFRHTGQSCEVSPPPPPCDLCEEGKIPHDHVGHERYAKGGYVPGPTGDTTTIPVQLEWTYDPNPQLDTSRITMVDRKPPPAEPRIFPTCEVEQVPHPIAAIRRWWKGRA